MNISESEFDLIEAFLLNQLSDEESASFSKELKSNSELETKVELVKLQINSVEDAGRKEFLNSIHKPVNRNEVIPINSAFSKLKSLSVAASVAVLIGIASIYILSENQSDNLYAHHFTPDEGLITPMSSKVNYEFYRGMVDYKQGKYDHAINRWKQQLASNQDNDTLNYFIAVSLMTKYKTKEAIPYLMKAEELESGVFYQDVLFYRALAELNEGNTDIAISYLENCSSSEAKALLKILNEN